jgi:hypothetical protein
MKWRIAETPAASFRNSAMPTNRFLSKELGIRMCKINGNVHDWIVGDMEAMRSQQDSPGLVDAESDKLLAHANGAMKISLVPSRDVYEIHPRKDKEGFDLISDSLRFGPVWYSGPDAVRYAVAYAKYRSRSRSHRAIIRVFNESGNLTETHEHVGDSKEWSTKSRHMAKLDR